jgi:hypothetical protein
MSCTLRPLSRRLIQKLRSRIASVDRHVRPDVRRWKLLRVVSGLKRLAPENVATEPEQLDLITQHGR